MSDIQTQLDYADAIAEWFLEIGEAHNLRGELEEGMKCAYVAATILSKQNRSLSSARLESSLRFIADRLAEYRNPQVLAQLKTNQKDICLHVMSEALPAGGISSMVIRWINNDRKHRVHSLVLLEKQLPIPGRLLQVVAETGGSIYLANSTDSVLDTAAWLRTLINRLAATVTAVILHIDVSDVICGVALGTTGGPPVLLVNYTAHSFWTGASIADLVLNVRGSALEKLWTAKYRGTSHYATLPIPLLEPDSVASDNASYAELKHQAKQSIGIPVNSVVILTVGASFKFLPTKTLDFLEECETILKQLPNGFLLVVGFDGDSRWRKASSRLGSRIRTLGIVSQAKLAKIHEAADLYIEGFPFGTTTSLLEAGLKGIPVVLAPAQCPPPYGSDGVALDDILERPTTLDDYRTKIIRLARNPVERKYQGENIRNSIAIHHTGSGWSRYLEDALARLPTEHSTDPSITPIRTPETINEYWAAFVAKTGSGYEETLELAISRALSIGIRPKLTRSMQQACKHFKSIRAHRTIPLPLLIFLCNFLLQIIPLSWAHNIFRLFSFLYRPSLLSRVRSKLPPLLGGIEGTAGMYTEYRKVNEPSELSFKKEKPI